MTNVAILLMAMQSKRTKIVKPSAQTIIKPTKAMNVGPQPSEAATAVDKLGGVWEAETRQESFSSEPLEPPVA